MSISAKGNNYRNVSREESEAINSLKSDRTIAVKEADKGSGVVAWDRDDYIMEAWDRDDYIMEAESQLSDSEVYSKLGNEPRTEIQVFT